MTVTWLDGTKSKVDESGILRDLEMDIQTGDKFTVNESGLRRITFTVTQVNDNGTVNAVNNGDKNGWAKQSGVFVVDNPNIKWVDAQAATEAK